MIFAGKPLAESPTAAVEDGCFRQVEYAGVLRGARNEAGARTLIDFMLSERFQADVPGSMFVYPVRKGVPLPEAFTKYAIQPAAPLQLSAVAIEAGRDAWIDEWTQTRAPLSGRLGRAAAAAVPLGFLAVFFAWPLAAILERSLHADGKLDIPLDVLARRATLEVAWFTLWQAALSTALTLVAALPLTWALARFSFPGRRLAEAFVLVPFVLPTVVVATAFLAVLPDGLEGTVWAILLAHVFFNVAVIVRIVGSFWAELDDRAWDAAATLGAGPWRRLRTVTLPLLAPALAAAGAITFLFCFTSFGIVVILGGPRYATLEAEIYNQAARNFDLRTAAALALLQLAAVTATVVVAGRLEARLGGGRRARNRPLGRPEGRLRLAVALVVGGSLALLAVPVAALVERAFSVPGGHGLDHFRALARRHARAARGTVARNRQLARVRRRRHGDRAGRRDPGCAPGRRRSRPCGRGGGDAAAGRLGGDARVRLPARLRLAPARPAVVAVARPARAGPRGNAVRGADDGPGAALDRRPPA